MNGVNLKKEKKLLYKQKKFLLLNLTSIILMTNAVCASGKERLDNDINAGVTKQIYDYLSDDSKDLKSGCAGVTKQILEYLSDDDMVNSNDVCAGVTEQILESLSNDDARFGLESHLDELTISKSAEVTSDCGCPIEWEDYVYQMGEKYGFPGNILMTILYRESGGNFDTNGVISTTNDYGLAQINKCNFDTIYNRLGFSEDEILNDPYKNIEAAALLISDIFKYYNYTTLDYDSANVFGCYNGWSNWRSIESAKNYSNACVEIMNLYYSDDNKCLVRQSN